MQKERALVEWLGAQIGVKGLTIEKVKDPKYLHQLSMQLPDLKPIQFNAVEDIQPWQRNYINLKGLYQAIEHYYRVTLCTPFPPGLPSINLLQIAKDTDQHNGSLVSLLIIFFMAFINSSEKEKCITCIISLNEEFQGDLMALIQQKTMSLSSDKEEELQKYIKQQQNDKNELDHLYFRIQSLESENDSLNAEMLSLIDDNKKMKEAHKKLEEENKKLKRDLDQKILYITQKQQQEQQEQSTNQILSESNEQIIKQLKRQLFDQERKNLKLVSQLREQIQDTNRQLSQARDRISELEADDLIVASSNKHNHSECVSISEHRNTTNKLQLKLKAKEHKEIQLEREIIKLKYEIQELHRKIRKEEKENQIAREERAKNSGQLIPAKKASQLRFYILQKVRDSLKVRLEKEKQSKLDVLSQNSQNS